MPPMTFECVCGHGGDGKHTVTEAFGMLFVACPWCPPDTAYIFGSAAHACITNIGDSDEAG